MTPQQQLQDLIESAYEAGFLWGIEAKFFHATLAIGARRCPYDAEDTPLQRQAWLRGYAEAYSETQNTL